MQTVIPRWDSRHRRDGDVQTTMRTCSRQKRGKFSRRFILVAAVLTACGVVVVYRQSTIDVDELFAAPLAEDDLRSLDITLDTVLNVLDRLNLTYFMTGGTLLGSYRHHGRIPWDDDVDLILNSSNKDLVWRSLTALKPDYGLFLSGYIDSPYHWKVYPRRHGRPVPLKPFRSPYVDLFFFRENATHVWNESPWFLHQCWARSAVFPLRRRPFNQFQIPAPCDMERIVPVDFDVSLCVSRGWSHIYDVPMPWRSITVPCATFAHRHPFVRRSFAANTGRYQQVTESLMLGNRTLHSVILNNGC